MLGDLKFWVESKLFAIVQYGRVARATANGADGADGAKTGGPQNVRRMWPWGLRSVPPVGSELLQVCPGGHPANAVVIAAETTKMTSAGVEYAYGPADLKEGETALYDRAGSVIRQSQDGTTKIDAAAGSDIVLNGGTAQVARVGDHARVTLRAVYTVVSPMPPTFALTFSVVQGTSVTTLFSFTAAGSVAVPMSPGVPYDVEIDSEIFEGAQHVTA